jgi:hypothetical protein
MSCCILCTTWFCILYFFGGILYHHLWRGLLPRVICRFCFASLSVTHYVKHLFCIYIYIYIFQVTIYYIFLVFSTEKCLFICRFTTTTRSDPFDLSPAGTPFDSLHVFVSCLASHYVQPAFGPCAPYSNLGGL